MDVWKAIEYLEKNPSESLRASNGAEITLTDGGAEITMEHGQDTETLGIVEFQADYAGLYYRRLELQEYAK